VTSLAVNRAVLVGFAVGLAGVPGGEPCEVLGVVFPHATTRRSRKGIRGIREEYLVADSAYNRRAWRKPTPTWTLPS